MQSSKIEYIADSILKSKYYIAASGDRVIDKDEIKEIINIIFDGENVLEKLEILYKYHPETILLSKSLQQMNCKKFNDNCDCFLPDIKKPYCIRQREETLKKTDRRNTQEYIEWRKNIFERDRYTCQICNKTGCILNAHHIKSFKDYHDLRYVLDNGVTLCEKCHKEIHKNAN